MKAVGIRQYKQALSKWKHLENSIGWELHPMLPLTIMEMLVQQQTARVKSKMSLIDYKKNEKNKKNELRKKKLHKLHELQQALPPQLLHLPQGQQQLLHLPQGQQRSEEH